MKRELNPTFYALSITLLISTIIFHSAEAFDDKLLGESNQICAVDLRGLMISLADKKEKSAQFTEEKFLKTEQIFFTELKNSNLTRCSSCFTTKL